jgi:hypothetical protein
MSWYYAGPEAKPVGPVSLEEIHARRLSGFITPETYVIEQNGQSGAPIAWRRYREIFSEGVTPPPILPPLPSSLPPALPHPPAPAIAANPAVTALFPSAPHAPLPVYVPPIVPHAAPHGHYPIRQTNSSCAWGFGLGLASFILSFACGLGVLFAAPALVLCILGFAQVQQRPGQSGRGIASAGAVLAALALLISGTILAYGVPALIKEREQAAAQQNSE